MESAPRSTTSTTARGGRWSANIARALISVVALGAAAWFLAACAPPPPCNANWVGPAGGDFAIATSWDTGTVPGPATVACAPAGSSITVSDARTVANAQLAGTVRITPAGVLTLGQDTSTIAALILEGELGGDAQVNVTGLTWTGGRMTGNGATIVLSDPSTISNATGTPKLSNSRTLTLVAPTTITAPIVRLCAITTLDIGGSVTVSGAGTEFTATGCGTVATGHVSIRPTATVTLATDTTFSRPLDNSGTIRVTGTTTATIADTFTQTAGTLDLTTVGSTLRIGDGTGTLAPSAGTIRGMGTIDGSVTGTAIIAPGPTSGNGAGILNVTGSYTAAPGAHLDLDLAGTAPGTTADQLHVGGPTDLDGTTARITYTAGFTPAPAQTFVVVDSTGPLNGQLDAVETPAGSGVGLRPIYSTNNLTLAVNQCDPAIHHPQADLIDASLTGTDLTGCNLDNADLDFANANGADLTGANLHNTSLVYSMLTNANLTDANLSGALMGNTQTTGVVWANTICPDGTNSDAHGNTCTANLMSTVFTVNAVVDAPDTVPGDGVCQTATPGQCTLRAAIQEANTSPVVNEVRFATPGTTMTLTVAGTDEDQAATGDLDITSPLFINGNGHTVESGGLDGVFDVAPGISAWIAWLRPAGTVPVRGIRNAGNLLLATSVVTSGGTAVENDGNLNCGCVIIVTGTALANTGTTVVRSAPFVSTARLWGDSGLVNQGILKATSASFRGSVALDNTGTAILSSTSIDSTDPAATVVRNAGQLTATDITITGGTKGIDNSGALTIAGGSITGATGIGIDTTGTSIIDTTTLDDNGIGVRSSGTTAIDRSTINNSQSTAPGVNGGILAMGAGSDLSVDRSTLSGNQGDGVRASGGTASFTDITVADSGAVGLVSAGASTTIVNSVIDAGEGTAACAGPIVSNGWNLASDASCSLAGTNDLEGIDPTLSRLGSHGGPTATHLPLFSSPAIDSGRPGCAPTDQRLLPRPVDGDDDTIAICDRGAVEVVTYHPLDITVNSTATSTDAVPGDGVCETTTPSECTLRAAITEANASFGPDKISLQPDATYTSGATALPTITTWLTLHGNGAGVVRSGVSSALTVTGNIDVTIDDLRSDGVADNSLYVADPYPWVTITDAELRTTGWVVAMYNKGTLAADRVNVVGGGLSNEGTATASNSSFTAADGSGVYTGPGATTTLLRATVSSSRANSATSLAGVVNAGTTVLRNVTITRNRGAGIRNDSGLVTASNTVVADQDGVPDCIGVITSLDWNLSSDASCGFTGVNDLVNTPGGLGMVLAAGDRWFHPPQPGSAAIDSGEPGCTGTDGRGLAVPVDGDGDATAACDRGATEAGPQQTVTLTVNATIDGSDATPGDGICETQVVGQCTLRAALNESQAINGAETIELQPGATYDPPSPPAASGFANYDGFWLSSPATVHGHGATIGWGPDPASYSIEVFGQISVHMDGLSDDGTIRSDEGDLHLDTVDVGGVFASGTLTADSSTIDVLYIGTGGVATLSYDVVRTSAENHGQLDATRSTFLPPVLTYGAGATSTISGSALTRVVSVAGSTQIIDSTIAGGYDAIDATAGSITVTNSIVAHSNGQDCTGPVVSGGWNIASDATCAFASTADLNSTDPQLMALADLGGGLGIRRPLLGSAAIDSGRPGCTGTDAAGTARPSDGDGNGSAACDRGAVELGPLTSLALTVNSTLDLVDADPGDNLCQTATVGQCTLRAAIMQSNATNGEDTIDLQPGVTYGVLPANPYGTDDDAAEKGDLDIGSSIVLRGHDATIDGSTEIGFDIFGAVTVAIDQVHINGAATGVTSRTADLTLTTVDVTHTGLAVSTAGTLVATGLRCHTYCAGGVSNAGTATLIDTSIEAVDDQLGTFTAISNSGTISISRSSLIVRSFWFDVSYTASSPAASLALDRSTLDGPVRLAGSSATVLDSTITAYSMAIAAGGGSVVLTNSIVASYGAAAGGGNPPPNLGAACDGPVTSGGWNIVTDSLCNLTLPSDIQNTDPRLLPVGDHGGTTWTMPPTTGSAAVDSGRPGCTGTDQRGVPRPADGDGNGSALCDRGAVEVATYQALSLTVNTTADGDDTNPGDALCETAVAGQCTLRAALQEADQINGADTIALPGSATFTFDGSVPKLAINSAVTINGNNSTVDGSLLTAVFGVTPSATVTINDLTLTRGADTTPGTHRALLIPANADVTLRRVVFNASKDNAITNFGHLVIADSSISDNASLFGSALENYGSAEISGSTFDHNFMSITNAGQMQVDSSTLSRTNVWWALRTAAGAATTIRRSTVSGNAQGVIALGGSQVWIYDSTLTANTGPALSVDPGGLVAIQRSIVANQTSGANCTGSSGIISFGYNLSSDTSCGFTAGTDLQNTAAGLNALANNGGLTKTHRPTAGSAAVNSGPATCAAAGADQRGVARPQGAACDRGSVER